MELSKNANNKTKTKTLIAKATEQSKADFVEQN